MIFFHVEKLMQAKISRHVDIRSVLLFNWLGMLLLKRKTTTKTEKDRGVCSYICISVCVCEHVCAVDLLFICCFYFWYSCEKFSLCDYRRGITFKSSISLHAIRCIIHTYNFHSSPSDGANRCEFAHTVRDIAFIHTVSLCSKVNCSSYLKETK